MESSSPTRNRTQTPCIGNEECYLLDHHQVPKDTYNKIHTRYIQKIQTTRQMTSGSYFKIFQEKIKFFKYKVREGLLNKIGKYSLLFSLGEEYTGVHFSVLCLFEILCNNFLKCILAFFLEQCVQLIPSKLMFKSSFDLCSNEEFSAPLLYL